MDAFIEFVKNWGYIAVFLGAAVEGESVILTASSMARFGYLDIYKVMIIAFISTTLADQILFFVGKYYGPSLFEKYPKTKPTADKVFHYLHKYDVWFILVCRFIYGIRIASSVVMGAAGIETKKFVPLNILSAFIWTVVSCGGGYLLGDIIFDMFNDFETAQKYLIGGFLAVIGIAIIYRLFKCKKKKVEIS